MYAYFNFRTMLRFLGIFIATLILVSIVPSFTDAITITYISPIPVATIFAIVIAFYISNAITRMENIQTNVAVELSRSRRAYHLANGFTSSQDLKKWGKELQDLVIEYLQSFGGHDFGEYNKSSKEFREITYHIYKMDPKLLKTPKEIAIYEELLTTTREWAMVRQNISERKKQRISLYSWVILWSISAILILFLMLLRTQDIFSTRIVAGLSIVAVLFTLDLLWEINNLSKPERRIFARKYLFNVDKLKVNLPDEGLVNKKNTKIRN
ncbi:MAG: hypothetical protein COU51_02160 [Parcubacteria group bacterium CG10_big_fil_rev_8_21_14_0_10_36_14]|nr:MAG: hypothetical protein COU51_02160 [Parcubacteria group bacterium CG10_big_fil_rev_8_21_14_0_10_36_14]